MTEPPRKLYLLTCRAPDGTIKRAWFGTRGEALKAAARLEADCDIAEVFI